MRVGRALRVLQQAWNSLEQNGGVVRNIKCHSALCSTEEGARMVACTMLVARLAREYFGANRDFTNRFTAFGYLLWRAGEGTNNVDFGDDGALDDVDWSTGEVQRVQAADQAERMDEEQQPQAAAAVAEQQQQQQRQQPQAAAAAQDAPQQQ